MAGTWTWNNPGEILTKVGTFKHVVTFTPKNTTHWYAVEKIIEVNVGKAAAITTKKYSKSYFYNEEYKDEIIDLAQFVPADAGNKSFTIKEKTYTGSDTVSSAVIDKGKLKFTVGKMTDLTENTSTLITIKISTDNYEDYTQVIEIKRNRGTAPKEGLWVADIPAQIYTGKAVKPELEVYCDGIKLVKGKDYTLTYKNNVKVAAEDAKNSKGKSIAPSVTVIGKGNYADKKTLNFAIVKCSIDSTSVDDITVAKTGKNIKINPSVKVNGRKLKAGTDFIVSTSTDPADALTALKEEGVYNLYVAAKGNYKGYVPFTFTITPDVLASKVKISGLTEQKYNGGQEIRPEVTVTYNKENVTEKFDVTYENNKEIGTATVIVTAKADSGFAGSKKASFKITGQDISVAKLGADGKGKIPEVTYSGIANEPSLDLYDGATPLVKNVDYTVSYAKNVNAGTATATVKGQGKYSGSKKFTFKINKYDAALDRDLLIKVNGGKTVRVPYEKGGVTPKPSITMNGTLLKEKTDYTLSYVNNKVVAGSGMPKRPTYIVRFKGNFSGLMVNEFEITAKDISKCSSITVADKVASTKANAWKQTSVTITDTNGKKLAPKTDYSTEFSYYSDEKCLNEITDEVLEPNSVVYVKVNGINNYAGSFVVGKYRISKQNVSAAKAVIGNQTFTGKEICPSAEEVTVTIGKGKNKKVLTAGVDYEIVPDSYTKNINKGKASLKIRGIGDYCGSKTVNFKIGAKKFLWWNL